MSRSFLKVSNASGNLQKGKETELFFDSHASSMVMRGSLSTELLLRIMIIHGSAHLNK